MQGQGQKYEFAHKPRKLLSRDRQAGLGSFHHSNRQKSRESDEKKAAVVNSPNKPHQLISSLRYQLTNLKQQVAKLSRKENRRTIVVQQAKLEPQNKGAKDKKNAYTYYFEDVKSTLPDEEQTVLRARQYEGESKEKDSEQSQMQALRAQIHRLSIRNGELQKFNQQMSVKAKEAAQNLKREYEMKLYQNQVQKDRSSRKKQNQQNDRTITFQKQLVENNQQIDILKQNVVSLTKKNQQLNTKILKMKTERKQQEVKDSTISEKDQQIRLLQVELFEIKSKYDHEATEKQWQIDELKKQIISLTVSLDQQMLLSKSFKLRLQAVNKKISENQNKIQQQQQSLQKYQLIIEQQKKKSKKIELPLGIKQLHEIIAMQEKGLLNQQSDINYLQNELRKLTHYRQISRNQSKTIDEMNNQLMRLNLSVLNMKYQNY